MARTKGSRQSGYGMTADEANENKIPCVHGHVGRWKARYTKQGRKNRTCVDCDNRRVKMHTYGLTEGSYKLLLDAHDNKCFICRKVSPLKIDHDHSTGEVRALICQRCNNLVGYLEGPFVERALVYIKMFKEHLIKWQVRKPKAGLTAYGKKEPFQMMSTIN